MDFKIIASEALEVLQLREKAIHAVAHDRSKLQSALLCLGAGALVSSLGFVLFPIHMGPITYRPDLTWVIGSALGGALGQAIVLILVGLLAENVFQSKLPAQGFFQVMAYASLINVLGLIPTLSVFSWIWILVVTVKVLRSEGQLETPALVLLLAFIILLFGSACYYQIGNYGIGMM
jgi:hypothetical protein